MQRLTDRVAVITGGASGIGAATVRRFVGEGARVVIADILDERGKHLVEELGDRVAYAHCDVSQERDIENAIAMATKLYGRLDCIFNNAGFGGVDGSLEEIPTQAFDETLSVLLRGVFLGMKHAAPIMKSQGSGSIINTGSVAGLQTGLGAHVYSAAKAAVIQLTRSVAMELAESRVRVNCICPGGIATPIFAKNLGFSVEEADRTIEAMNEALAGLQPIPRPGQPGDIAAAAVWLASDEASFVNGHALVVDGGLTGGRGWSESRRMREALRALLEGNRL